MTLSNRRSLLAIAPALSVLAVAGPDMQQFSNDLGAVPSTVGGDAFARMLKHNTKLWAKVAASAKVEKQ